jgi:hypothetical protein
VKKAAATYLKDFGQSDFPAGAGSGHSRSVPKVNRICLAFEME